MSNARKLADNLPTDGQLGNRNLIINGMFNCWQRGTSFSASGYGADRWTYGTSGGAGVHSRQNHSLADQTTFNTPYFHRLAVSSGNNNQGMAQNIEDITRFAGKTITVSFYLKGTNPAGGSFATILGGYMGSGGSGDWELTHADAITVTSSWQRFTREFTCPENTGRTIGTSHYLYFYPARQPSADNGTAAWTLDMANVQLEVGSQSTPFEHEPYQTTLRKCQRYFERRGTSVAGWEFIADAGQLTSTTAYQVAVRFNEQMRAAPTMSYAGTLSNFKIIRAGGVYDITSVTAADNTNGRTLLLTGNCGNTGGAAGDQARIQTIQPNHYFYFDAEL